MSFTVIPVLAGIGAVGALLLGAATLWRRPRTGIHWVFGAGMALLAAEAALLAFTLRAETAERVHFLLRLCLVALAVLPCPWLLFSSSFARDGTAVSRQRWNTMLLAGGILPVVFAGYFWDLLTVHTGNLEAAQEAAIRLGWPGMALNAWFLICAVGVLMNLERTFRASVGTIRWRIKFMLLGLGVLFVVRIYTSSQVLLFWAVSPSVATVNLLALPVACLLMTRSLAREGAFQVSVYPSRTVLQNSVTALCAGLYLLLVGVLAKVVTALGGDAAFPVKAFLVLLALVGLTILLISDRFQQRMRILVGRHFKRPLYDYLKVWHVFTERTTSLTAEPDLCRAVVRLISETFQVLSVTVWLIDERKDRLVFAASTALTESSGEKLSDFSGSVSELKNAFDAQSYPVDMETSREPWAEALKRCHPGHFPQGGHRVCVPLVAGGQLLGLITVGDRVSGVPLTVQDFDLLKCIGDQVAANLLNIQLSERLVQAKEMEAFQTMSAFFVHDLKNTASTLSLMLRNLPTHFEDPAFRADALRAVGKSVERINALISRLTLLRQKLEMNLKEGDLNEVVEGALAGLQAASQTRLAKELCPLPGIAVDPEQLQKVVTNLVLNAWDAVSEIPDGSVRVGTFQQNGWAVLSISDNGCGMTPEFMKQSLFRPFQTTKKKGIGIGMFHSKAIVEAHRGKIEVESAPGEGTTFKVMLPIVEKKA